VNHGVNRGIVKNTLHNSNSYSKCKLTLTELYQELGTIKWFGDNDKWDSAITEVRKYIKDNI